MYKCNTDKYIHIENKQPIIKKKYRFLMKNIHKRFFLPDFCYIDEVNTKISNILLHLL